MYETIIHFWFEEIDSSSWWKKDLAFDKLIESKFKSLHERAVRCELYGWRGQALGRLAEIILLDQFSRNMYRDTPRAFASDALALALAQEAVYVEADKDLSSEQKSFLYMPYMHSESPLIHQQAVGLFTSLGGANSLDFELKHKAIIDRFGRYPHRNEILGRESTPEELEFLQEPGSSF